MRILLVRPPRMKQAVIIGEFMFSEPLGLEMMVTVLKDTHEVEILDMMTDSMSLETKLAAFQPQVVGITSLCIDVEAVLALARQTKTFNPAIQVVAGGTQATLQPQAFIHAAVDHVIQYAARQNITQLMNLLAVALCPSATAELPLIEGIRSRSHQYQEVPPVSFPPCNEYILPDRKSTLQYRSSYSYFGYRPCALLGTSRGCSKTCDFCLRWRLEGSREHYFPMEQVQADIESIEEPNVMIFDNDFLHNPHRVMALCDYLEAAQIHKNWICYASVHSILNHPEAVARFRDLGLQAVLVGYETFSDEELAQYRKKTSRQESLEASRFLKKLGVDVWASFMAHPDWSKEDFRAFRRFIRELNPEISSISPLTPFPGLPLYEQYQDRLLYPREAYAAWSFGQVMIRPGNMSLVGYYGELLKTNFYVNLVCNSLGYVVNKFGPLSLLRLTRGSLLLLIRYLKLMWQAR
ncbi:B12-binding domain-containing radical SAM protein [Anoxynatronum buryatiense]|uniref:Radical SAM superfamily enzyme YgiQ, UPF0313 family n=1 Tax=Anoxynatronum buryatiense TaxID=489973 RepID=A0AA46AK70_9CLOT|nr:radical SAM protein [Anoxynatronum buryatiense]SMP66751.1 Radical SAM superfamily enzyme YgiQ, UPF0313 family [Anoxynatronum buryatiense]